MRLKTSGGMLLIPIVKAQGEERRGGLGDFKPFKRLRFNRGVFNASSSKGLSGERG